jgi:hypothetical protein
VTAREYIEAIASELSQQPGRGLVLSPADAALALSWHSAGVPLGEVRRELGRLDRLPQRPERRGATEPGRSLQMVAPAIESRWKKRAPRVHRQPALCAELLRAARAPKLAGRGAWESLAGRAEELLEQGGDGYWSEALSALRSSLLELPRTAALQAGAELRARMAPRPPAMPRRLYRRSLQIQLLAAASNRLGVPPRAFLL